MAGEDPDRVVRDGFRLALLGDDVGALVALPFAEPISEALLDELRPGPGPDRDRRALGLHALRVPADAFRLDERARAYFVFTIANVAGDDPAHGLRWSLSPRRARAGCCSAATRPAPRSSLGLILRPAPPPLAASSNAGCCYGGCSASALPTMPAELSLYSLNFIDRIIIVRFAGLAEAGLYALAVKFAQAVNVARARLPARLAAARLLDPRRRRGAPRLRADRDLVRRRAAPSWSSACGCCRAGSCAPWRRRSSSSSYEAVGLISTGVDALRALPGPGRDPRPHRPNGVQLPGHDRRHGGQRRPQPALVPPLRNRRRRRWRWSPPTWSCSALMYGFTQRLFPVPYEWGRLALVVGAAALAGRIGRAGCCPPRGASGPLPAAALWLALPGRCCGRAGSSLAAERRLAGTAAAAAGGAGRPPALALRHRRGPSAAARARGLRGRAARRGLATALDLERLAGGLAQARRRAPGSSAWRAWAR